MREVVKRAARAAASESTVLITGAPGAGKQELALWIHRRPSSRDRQRFSSTHCTARWLSSLALLKFNLVLIFSRCVSIVL